MRTRFLAFSFCLPLLVSSTLALAESDSKDSSRTGTVAAIAAEIHALGLYPGLSIAATTADGKTIAYPVGQADLSSERPVTAQTTFRMYSVSKGLTRILAAVLVDKGKLDLDAPASRYLSDVPQHLQPITVRQLLDHTSGIRHYRGADEWLKLSQKSCKSPLEALPEFANDPLLFSPGSKESYSSFGYVVLSAVLEKAGGESFDALMHRYLFEPSNAQLIALDGQVLKGNDTTLFYERSGSGKFDVAAPVDNSCKFGGGGINASSQAVAKIYSAFYAAQLTSPATLKLFIPDEQSHRPYVSVGGEGLGGRSVAAAYPAQRIVVVIATNARGGNLEPYARRIADALND